MIFQILTLLIVFMCNICQFILFIELEKSFKKLLGKYESLLNRTFKNYPFLDDFK